MNDNKENGNPHGNNTTNLDRIHIGNHNNIHYCVDTYKGQASSKVYGVEALQKSDSKKLASDEIRGTNAQNIRR